MSKNIEATPAKAPYPVPEFLSPANISPMEMYNQCSTATTEHCQIPVNVGLFFDGTNNHMERDRDGKRVPVPLTKEEKQEAKRKAKAEGLPYEEPQPAPVPDVPITQEKHSHSNVARLFEAFLWDKQAQGYHPFYIQGVGTPFPKIGEPTESQEGKAFAKGGLPRIVWGIFQVMNAIHLTLFGGKSALYEDIEVGQLAQAYGREVGRTEPGSERMEPLKHEDWFAPHLTKLKAALDAKPKPAIPSVSVSVFGFSRGGAEAVAFCHLFNRLLKGGKLAGIAARIQFVGLFDVVASVGGSASVAKTMPLPGALFDGHWSWANDVDEPLPGCVEKAVHLIAAHELRMNFPVTRIVGAREIYVPGVHSDVGGGYGPGEQGRSRGGQGMLLSQIPLAFMYKEAQRAGVPLVPFSELPERDQTDFKIDASLAQAWEVYTTALNGQGNLLKMHMGLYYRWRAARLSTMDGTTSFQAASAQSQQDLREANLMLAGDLEALRYRRDNPKRFSYTDGEQQPVYGGKDSQRINQWHLIRANNSLSLDEWESFALGIFDNPQPLPPAVMAFFDDYVHDSFAGFYMAGEVTEYDKRAKVKEVMRKKPEQRNDFEVRVAEITRKTEEARRKRDAGEPLSAEDEALLKADESGTPYPVMSDEDAADMRQWPILTQTATRREGGGYILRRGYYPHSGFFLRRSIHEEELEEAPKAEMLTPAQKKMAAAKAESADEKAPREFVWSSNLAVDIPKARAEEAGKDAVAMC